MEVDESIIQQISKCIRGKEDKKHLTEEIADAIRKQSRTDLRIQKEKKDGRRN